MDKIKRDEFLSMESNILQEYVEKEFFIELPESLDSEDDMKNAIGILSKATSYYSYLSNMAVIAKLEKRRLKRDGASKEDVEKALSVEEIFSNAADIAKATYNAVSRMFTIKQQIAEELKMSKGF